MQAGRLRFSVTIEQNAGLQDGSGSQKPVWTPVCTVWADIKPLSGRELLTAQAEMSEISVRIVMRYRPGITAAMRVVHDGVIYAIAAPPINTDNRNRELQIMCASGVSKG